jgi:hypothetical protein
MFFKKGNTILSYKCIINVLNMQKMKSITNIYKYYHSFSAHCIMQNMSQWKNKMQVQDYLCSQIYYKNVSQNETPFHSKAHNFTNCNSWSSCANKTQQTKKQTNFYGWIPTELRHLVSPW